MSDCKPCPSEVTCTVDGEPMCEFHGMYWSAVKGVEMVRRRVEIEDVVDALNGADVVVEQALHSIEVAEGDEWQEAATAAADAIGRVSDTVRQYALQLLQPPPEPKPWWRRWRRG